MTHVGAYLNLFDSAMRIYWYGNGLSTAQRAHADWFKGDYSLWAPARSGTIHRRRYV